MPPRSYLITAAVLVVLVAVSLPLTMGFSIILWHWLFAGAGCILIVLGALRIVRALGAPAWIGVALALPGLLWALGHLRPFMNYVPTSTSIVVLPFMAFSLAMLAAAAGALRLIEILWKPHVAFRVGYGILAAAALISVANWIAHFAGLGFSRNATYAALVRPVSVAAMLVKYGALVGAALLVTLRREVEIWTGATIGLIGLYMLYQAIQMMFAIGFRGDTSFWLQPILMLIGGVAIWRIGSNLRAQAGVPQASVQST